MAWNDSRDFAKKFYKKLKLNVLFNTSTFLGNAVLASIFTYGFAQLDYGEAVNFVFFVSVLSIGLWITEAIPPFAVGILIVGLLLAGFGTDLVLDSSTPVDIYIDTWTSNVIWLLLGGFFLAEGMKEAGLDRDLFSFTVKRFGNKPERLLLGLMMVTATSSMVMSNTATTAMMISSILPLVRLLGKGNPFSVALLTGIPAAASVGGIGTIIGSTPNAIAVGALMEQGIYISFVEWMILGVPAGFTMVYLFYRFLIKKLDFSNVQLDTSALIVNADVKDKRKRISVLVTLVLTVGLWLTEPLHGIPVAATSAVPIVLLTLLQVLDAENVRRLPWETLMLVAGGLALGIALVEVGLASIIMNKVNNLPLAMGLIALLFSAIGVLLSNVMSNTAAASILIPLSVSLAFPFGLIVPVAVAITCSCALLLPVSTPSNAISYATGLVTQRDFRRGGLFFIIRSPFVALAFVTLWVFILFIWTKS
jgi:solute carrier family 13 (sodium-dependent dicarboxylate transporter), member 2/3/5